MSFGWSAGDIAQAVVLVVKLARALDDANGAASDYREAVAFLTSLKRTLEPLQTLSAFNLRPAYSEEITLVVKDIKAPVEKFLALTGKFEHSLGSGAHVGSSYRHVGKKLQWRFVTSKRVDGLRASIESHLGILNNLLQRLTLELVQSAQSNLGAELRRNFTEVIDPRLVALLQEQLQPLTSRLLKSSETTSKQFDDIASRLGSLSLETSQAQIFAKFQDQEKNQAAAVETIKQHITSAIQDLRDGERSKELRTNGPLTRQVARRYTPDPLSESLETLHAASENQVLDHGSLEELYYLALVYLGYFLRDLFLALCRKVRPVPTLTPRLLAKYHISFHDALGRPPRVLDYDCFVSFRVFKAFLEDSFFDTTGSSWIERGLYTLTEAKSKKRLSDKSWSSMVYPGVQIIMSMLVEQPFFIQTLCPLPSCMGPLVAHRGTLWTKCSICGMEVMNEEIGNEHEMPKQRSTSPTGVKDIGNDATNAAVKTRKQHARVPLVVSHVERISEDIPETPSLDGSEKFQRVERVHSWIPQPNTAPGQKHNVPSRTFRPAKAKKKPKRMILKLVYTKDTAAAQKVLDHLKRGPSDQKLLEDYFISLIGRDDLDDQALNSILTTADSIFFAGLLAERVKWEWSEGVQYQSNLLSSTLRAHGPDQAQRGYSPIIVLSAPMLKDPRYTSQLLILVFLQALIDSYIYIVRGFEVGGVYIRLREFNIIARHVQGWIKKRCSITRRLHNRVTVADLKDFEKTNQGSAKADSPPGGTRVEINVR